MASEAASTTWDEASVKRDRIGRFARFEAGNIPSPDYLSGDEADEWGADAFPNDLSPEEMAALSAYRNGQPADGGAIEGVLDRHSTPEDVWASRFASPETFGTSGPAELLGAEFENPVPMSTVVGDEVPKDLAKRFPITMRMKVGAGTPAYYADGIGGKEGDRELLVGRGAKLKVTGVKETDDGRWDVFVEATHPQAKRRAKAAKKQRDEARAETEALEAAFAEPVAQPEAEAPAEAEETVAQAQDFSPEMSNKEMDAWAKEAFPVGKQELSPEELEIVQQYQSAGYQRTNKYLRGQISPPANTRAEIEGRVATIDAVMERSRVPEDITVLRAMGTSAFGDVPLEEIAGKTFRDNGYQSTALKSKPPYDFAAKQVVMNLQVPEGTPGIYLSPIAKEARFKREQEMLLGRGLDFRVTDARYNPRNGKWTVDAEIVP